MIEGCTALILAGGDSRRMGQDKASLVLDGRTLLEHVTATMQAVFPEVIVSVRQTRAGLDVPQVCDEVPAGGPLAGLIAGLTQAGTPWVFAVACDMPFITGAMVEGLSRYRFATAPRPPGIGNVAEYQAVVPMIGGFPQPLAAFYAASALATMRASLAGGDSSLRGMLKKLDVCFVGETELRACDPQLRSFFDLDTPQDVQAAKR